VAGVTRSTTSRQPAVPAIPASATTKSPADCAARGSMSEPSTCATSRSKRRSRSDSPRLRWHADRQVGRNGLWRSGLRDLDTAEHGSEPGGEHVRPSNWQPGEEKLRTSAPNTTAIERRCRTERHLGCSRSPRGARRCSAPHHRLLSLRNRRSFGSSDRHRPRRAACLPGRQARLPHTSC